MVAPCCCTTVVSAEDEISISTYSHLTEDDLHVFHCQSYVDDLPTPCQHSSQTTSPAAREMTYQEHLLTLAKLCYPIIANELLQNIMHLVDLAFISNLGSTTDLAACALATTWFNIWNAAISGFLTATDTLLAQSFGASKLQNYGIWTGNSLILTFFLTIIVSALIAMCGPVMHVFVPDPHLAHSAGAFSLRLIPGLFPYYAFKTLVKYLQVQHVLAPSAWIGILANGLNAFLNWILIYQTGWGVNGSAWATTFTRTAEFLLILIFLLMQKKNLISTWPQFSINNLHLEVLRPFLVIAISGTFASCLVVLVGEMMTVLACSLGAVQLGAHFIVASICCFFFLSFPLAIGIATSIQVGHLIGSGKGNEAKKLSTSSFLLSFVMQGILCILLFLGRRGLSQLFTSDEYVSNVVLGIIPIMLIDMMGDTLNSTIGGILRGVGRQHLSLLLYVISTLLLALPIGSTLAHQTPLGVYGLWWGMAAGTYASCSVGLTILHHIDWQEEVRKAVRRVSIVNYMEVDSHHPLNENLVDHHSHSCILDDSIGTFHFCAQ